MSVIVKYTDIAIGAKESFNISTAEKLYASNIDLIKTEGATFKRYDIPFDLNSMILDGSINFLPEDSLADVGFISEQLSDENGDFLNPIIFEFNADEAFTSAGITIRFDEEKNIYSSHINIKWYNGDMLLDEEDFFPTSANYFCNKKVEFYNKFVITFYSLSVPQSRLILNHIEYGIKTEFGADELKSAKIIQEIDPISTTIPINPFDFIIDSKKDIEFSFQTKQPIEVIFNGETKAVTFVKSAKRKSKKIWDIKSEDYIGLMDSIYFKGGIYTNKNALELLDEIFSVAKVPYNILGNFENINLTGYIPYTTCRDALMQVIFAIGAVADTSNSDKVNIFALSKDISQELPKRRILQGQNFEDETRVTAIELVSHAYNEISESLVAYESAKSGTGENIFVLFSEPLHSLTITNGSIIESGVNYAIINANLNCVLSGSKFEHTKVMHRKNNPLVLSTDIENVFAIENATLVSSNNVDNILSMCYNFLVNTEKTTMKIIDGFEKKKDANFYGLNLYGASKYGYTINALKSLSTTVGDLIAYETEYLGDKTGRIIKQSFALLGGMLIKDSIVR
jgi:hypothetical protein